MSDITSRLEMIRTLMREEQIDAWVDFGSDPHGSEYVAPRWRSRAWLSGFTGSAGTIVITQESAQLWVDFRYHIQASQQIDGSPFTLQKLGNPGVVDHFQWIVENLSPGSTVGMAGLTVSIAVGRSMREALSRNGLDMVYTDDWLEKIWSDRPALPCEDVDAQDVAVSGTSARAKIEKVRKTLALHGCTYTIISSLDDIAWLLNLRGADIAFNPVFLSYLLVGEKSVVLFTEGARLDSAWVEDFSSIGEIMGYDEIFEYLPRIFNGTDTIYLSPEKTSGM